jgi:CRISPR/Cas system CMR-associated protein Cmr1 (group 7 of RAMP superfamily)
VKGEVLKAFALLVAYGGLGAKSRNGFGSLRLLKGELPDVSAIKEEHDLLSYPSFSKCRSGLLSGNIDHGRTRFQKSA